MDASGYFYSMSDFFKNLRSLFVVEEDGSPDHENNEEDKVQDPGPSGDEDVLVGDGKVSSKFVDILLQAMSNNNLEGIDYLEYRNSLDSLRDMEMDELTRFQSAFAMARTMGATPEVLINSTNHYKQVLDNEQKKFKEALAKHQQLQVKKRELKIEDLKKEVDELSQQITELNARIDKREKEIIMIRDQKASAEKRMINTKRNFEASYQFVVERINEDLQKMKKYLMDG